MSRVLFLLHCLIAAHTVAHAQRPIHEPTHTPPPSTYQLITGARPAYLRPASPASNVYGLYTKDGRELLPPHYYNVSNYDTGVALTEGILFLLDTAGQRYQDMGFEVKPGYEIKPGAFTRGGLLLYEPYWYDNGPDFFAEGRQRFVYNNNIGFVNRYGEVAVPAQYGYATQYHHGTAMACRNCVYKTIAGDGEHGYFSGTRWEEIDPQGRVLRAFDVCDTCAAPQQPATAGPITAKEAALAAVILRQPVLLGLLARYGLKPAAITPVCYDRPSAHSPYYHLSFEHDGIGINAADFQFLISPDGHKIYHLSWDLQRTESMAVWKEYLDNVSEE